MQEQPEFQFFEEQNQQENENGGSKKEIDFFRMYLGILSKPDNDSTSATVTGFFKHLQPEYELISEDLSDEEKITFQTIAEKVSTSLLNETDNLLTLLGTIMNDIPSFRKYLGVTKEKISLIEKMDRYCFLTREQQAKMEQQRKRLSNLEIEVTN